MERISTLTIAIAMLTGGLVAVLPAASASPAGPVTNSNFEVPPVPDETGEALEGTPADQCYGVGHQVLYGSESPQGQATGGTYDSPNPEEADPAGAATSVVENPQATADQQTSCVWNSEDGYDLAWVHPRARTTQPAHWSIDIRNPSADFGFNLDDDPSDKEVRLIADDSLAHHNLWQWIGSKHQAFTPNADALSMDVEKGDVSGIVKLILTNMPSNTESTDYYQPCSLTFTQTQLANAMDADGHIAADPTNAQFKAREDSCQNLEDQWDGGDEDAKRDVLSQTRITQLSFWGWERGTDTDTVIDNVELPGASTAAEAALGAPAP